MRFRPILLLPLLALLMAPGNQGNDNTGVVEVVTVEDSVSGFCDGNLMTCAADAPAVDFTGAVVAYDITCCTGPTCAQAGGCDTTECCDNRYGTANYGCAYWCQFLGSGSSACLARCAQRKTTCRGAVSASGHCYIERVSTN